MKKQKYLFVSTEKWIYLIAIMVTFVICGIWHGVGWTYLVWGILFGIYLTYSNWTGEFNKNIRKRFHKKSLPIILKLIKLYRLFVWSH